MFSHFYDLLKAFNFPHRSPIKHTVTHSQTHTHTHTHTTREKQCGKQASDFKISHNRHHNIFHPNELKKNQPKKKGYINALSISLLESQSNVKDDIDEKK